MHQKPQFSPFNLTPSEVRLVHISNCPRRQQSPFQKLVNTPYLNTNQDRRQTVKHREDSNRHFFDVQTIEERKKHLSRKEVQNNVYQSDRHKKGQFGGYGQTIDHSNLNQQSQCQRKGQLNVIQENPYESPSQAQPSLLVVIKNIDKNIQNPYWNVNLISKAEIYSKTKQNPLTCTDILLQLKASMKNKLASVYKKECIQEVMRRVVGFRTMEHSKSLELDMILSLGEYQIDVFEQQLTLEPVYGKGENIGNSNQRPKLLMDYQFIKFLGSGGFSTVHLARHINTNAYYAIKLLFKSQLSLKNRPQLISIQKSTLASLGHSFITRMYDSFQTASFYVFVLEWDCAGGELFSRLRKVGRMGEQEAKFYFMEVLLALGHMHAKGIIYRDIKPENVLIDAWGHIRLADFGLSKTVGRDKIAYSFCGSPQYMAPQMLTKEGHTRMLDLYCVGCLLYELVYSAPPFYSTDLNQIYSSIMSEEISFPEHPNTSSEFKHFLRSLLKKNPEERLGATGIDQLFRHPFLMRNCTVEINHQRMFGSNQAQNFNQGGKINTTYQKLNYRELLLKNPPFVPKMFCGQLIVSSGEDENNQNASEVNRIRMHQKVLEKELFEEENQLKLKECQIKYKNSPQKQLQWINPIKLESGCRGSNNLSPRKNQVTLRKAVSSQNLCQFPYTSPTSYQKNTRRLLSNSNSNCNLQLLSLNSNQKSPNKQFHQENNNSHRYKPQSKNTQDIRFEVESFREYRNQPLSSHKYTISNPNFEYRSGSTILNLIRNNRKDKNQQRGYLDRNREKIQLGLDNGMYLPNFGMKKQFCNW